jgi:N-acetyl-gamma-glutamyl-phosphate reductase
MQLEKIAIVGATGYSGEELIRLLQRHPGVELACVTSRQYAGKALGAVYPKFQGLKYDALAFSASDPVAVVASGARVVFLALPHGLAAGVARPLLDAGLRVIDLSADFRIKDQAAYKEFYGQDHPAPELLSQSVYGLPELHRGKIAGANLVASPGCYPTSIILPLVPLLKAGLVDPESIIVSSMSGVSGAGRKVDADYLFVECNESVRPYAVPRHRHLPEIEQELGYASGGEVIINFTPHLIPVNRGILSTIYVAPAKGATPQKISEAMGQSYKNEPFIRLLGEELYPDIKNVAYTNFIDIAWRHDPRTGRFIVMSAIDNLIKGASGQAVQSMNLMCGLPETLGL